MPRGTDASRPWGFVWARMVRDSAGNCLPFSQMGGFVLGARALTTQGVGWPLATASLVVDVTAEFLAQIVFAGVRIGDPSRPRARFEPHPPARGRRSRSSVPAAPGSSTPSAGPRRSSSASASTSRASGSAAPATGSTCSRPSCTGSIDRAGHVALGASLHLLGWFCTGIAGWLAYRLLGSDIDLASVLALEALLNVALAVAFLVPAAAGVQEAAYAGIGVLFGLPPEMSLGVSLLRRAKDLAIGIPILLAWQITEMRRLRLARHS